MRRRTIAATAAALLAAALLAPTSTAHADPQPPVGDQPPPGFATWEALFAVQDARNNAVEAIRNAATAAGDTGYSTAIADPTQPGITLRWKGTPLPATQAAINAQNAIAPVTVLPAAYNETQLTDEALRIGAASSAFYSAEPKLDGSGVHVTWNPGGTDHQLAADTIATAAVAVTFEGTEATEQPQPLSRQDDASPYKGGARTSNCTAGFAVNMNSGGTRLLYAAHCGASGSTVKDGGGQVMGSVGTRNSATDTATISASSSGYMWDGGVQSTFYKSVKAAAPALVGNYICTSGSRSGVVCAGKINAVGVSNGSIGPLARFVNVNGQPMVGSGDSGGPAFATRSTGGVTAQGIISSGYAAYRTTTCAGEGGRACYKGGHIVDVRQMLSRVGATIRTS